MALTALALSLSAAATATPLYYTFSGTVTDSDVGSLPAGSPVSYTFLMDFDRQANFEQMGETWELIDGPDVDYFYAEYVGGSAVPRPPSTPPNTLVDHWGIQEVSDHRTVMYASVTDLYWNDVYLTGTGLAKDWVVGQSMDFAFDRYEDRYGTGSVANVYSSLTLTAIDAGSPVPEPGTLLLLGGGVLGVAQRQRHRRSIRC